MTAFHLLPPLVAGTVAALIGAAVGWIASLNVYLPIFVSGTIGELLLLFAMVRTAPPSRTQPRVVLFIAGMYCAIGAIPCAFVASPFLKADLVKIQRERGLAGGG